MAEKKDKKEKKVDQEWDFKKIFLAFIAIIAVLLVGVWLKRGYFAEINSAKPATVSTKVPDVQKAVQEKIEGIKYDAAKINVEEVATSSPQVQKVINDIKSIQDYPSSQAKSMCQKICEGL